MYTDEAYCIPVSPTCRHAHTIDNLPVIPDQLLSLKNGDFM